ncbi:MAG: NfeD family protein [Planctomycetota bacterium]
MILFVAGIVFIAMEVFVIPGFGVSGLTGIILLFVSIVLAGQDFVIPQTGVQWNQTMSSTLLLLGSTFGFLIAAVLITIYAGSIPGLKRLILSPREIAEYSDGIEKDEHGKPIAKPHPEISVGDWGLADSLLRPAGRAKFGNRSFDVISDGNFIDPGTQVTVISIRGNVITVAAVEDENQDDENV